MAASTPAQPRVYWLTTEFSPPEMGGTGVIAARLAQGLAERDLSIQVITRQTLPHAPSREWIGKVWVRRVRPAGRMKGVGWRAFPVMVGYIARLVILLIAEARRYDIVIVSGMKTIPLAAVPVCRLLGKKCVVRIESPFEIAEPISAESLEMMHGVLGRMLAALLKRLQQSLMMHTDRMIAISEDIAGVLTRMQYPSSRIARIPNTISLAKFKPVSAPEKAALRQRLNIDATRTIVLYAGRLSRAKGVMMLMQAWPALIARHPHLFLVVVGSGRESWDSCEDDIVEFVRAHGLEQNVVLAGQSERVHEYLQAADLFVSPSDYEGFGLTIVEALACALPVVSTSVGIAPQIIHDGANGFLCPPKDPQGLNEAIERALRLQGGWPDIGRLAREAAAPFDVPQVINQYVTLCRELQTESGPRA